MCVEKKLRGLRGNLSFITLARDFFPIFMFLIFRRVENFDVRRNSNVHRATLVRSWLSLTDKQTNVRLENSPKLNWTKHKFNRGYNFLF